MEPFLTFSDRRDLREQVWSLVILITECLSDPHLLAPYRFMHRVREWLLSLLTIV